MGSATGRDLHVDNLMSQIALNFRPTGMVWDQVAPIVTVAKETDSYPVFSRAEAFATEDDKRSRGAEANRITRSVSSAQYAAKNYALAMDTAVEDRANMDAAFQFELDSGTTRYITTKLMLCADRRILPLAVAGVGTTILAGSSWNVQGTNGGDPVSQIIQVGETIKGATAQKPNSIVIGWKAWAMFRRNEKARNMVNGTNNGGGLLTIAQAKSLFEVDRFIVAEAFFNSANENKTAVFSTTFPFDGLLYYYAPLAPSREDPSFMYSFRWTNPDLGTPFGAIRHEFDTRKKVDGLEVSYYQDEKVTGSEYGAMLTGVGSAQANGFT
jgi:hypothetical protein